MDVVEGQEDEILSLNVEKHLLVCWRTGPYITMYKVCKSRQSTINADFLLKKAGNHQ